VRWEPEPERETRGGAFMYKCVCGQIYVVGMRASIRYGCWLCAVRVYQALVAVGGADEVYVACSVYVGGLFS
jgi:hypothetical protein